MSQALIPPQHRKSIPKKTSPIPPNVMARLSATASGLAAVVVPDLPLSRRSDLNKATPCLFALLFPPRLSKFSPRCPFAAHSILVSGGAHRHARRTCHGLLTLVWRRVSNHTVVPKTGAQATSAAPSLPPVVSERAPDKHFAQSPTDPCYAGVVFSPVGMRYWCLLHSSPCKHCRNHGRSQSPWSWS